MRRRRGIEIRKKQSSFMYSPNVETEHYSQIRATEYYTQIYKERNHYQ